jgi:hypothetical protein
MCGVCNADSIDARIELHVQKVESLVRIFRKPRYDPDFVIRVVNWAFKMMVPQDLTSPEAQTNVYEGNVVLRMGRVAATKIKLPHDAVGNSNTKAILKIESESILR